ncbi:MAG: helix-turn-helix domain-containing protein [Bacteroidetes bacterium]|nr:helix-turn-helix domain-containing protein [Bacteroidota bacterium]
MKKIAILVPEAAVMQAIADPQYLFAMANEFMVASGRSRLFQVQLVGGRRQVILNEGSYSVLPDCLYSEADKPDLILVPAVLGDKKRAIQENASLMEWAATQYSTGAEIASLCAGAFLLASTGMLDGRKCSTHWVFVNEFRDLYPDIEIVDGAVITEDNGIYSSGGANSYWNLLLHLLEKYTDRDTAILASKYFAIDIDRDNQSAFAMFRGQKGHNDPEILKAQEYIEANVRDRVTVDALANQVSIGRRSFERRFKQATSNSVLEYIQRVRIEAAKRSFESSRKNISEVMYEVGYTDTKAFRTIFKKITGLTPIEYRNKYNKMAAAV